MTKFDPNGFTEFHFPIEWPEEGEIYVLTYSREAEEPTPFYVGQTARFNDRMGDYFSAQFGASTDFKVGIAIRELQKFGFNITAFHKAVSDRCTEERGLIEQLRKEGFPLLNHYHPKLKSREEREAEIREHCRVTFTG